jgi:hypothetical protein
VNKEASRHQGPVLMLLGIPLGMSFQLAVAKSL